MRIIPVVPKQSRAQDLLAISMSRAPLARVVERLREPLGIDLQAR